MISDASQWVDVDLSWAISSRVTEIDNGYALDGGSIEADIILTGNQVTNKYGLIFIVSSLQEETKYHTNYCDLVFYDSSGSMLNASLTYFKLVENDRLWIEIDVPHKAHRVEYRFSGKFEVTAIQLYGVSASAVNVATYESVGTVQPKQNYGVVVEADGKISVDPKTTQLGSFQGTSTNVEDALNELFQYASGSGGNANDIILWLDGTSFEDMNTASNKKSVLESGATLVGGYDMRTGNVLIGSHREFELGTQDFEIDVTFTPTNLDGFQALFSSATDYWFGLCIKSGRFCIYASSNGLTWDILQSDNAGVDNSGYCDIPIIVNSANRCIISFAENRLTVTVNNQVAINRLLNTRKIFGRFENKILGAWANKGNKYTGVINTFKMVKGTPNIWSPLINDANILFYILGQYGYIDCNGYNPKTIQNINSYCDGNTFNLATGYFSVLAHPDFVGLTSFTLEMEVMFTSYNRQALFAGASDYWFGIDFSYLIEGCIGVWESSNGTNWDKKQCDNIGTWDSVNKEWVNVPSNCGQQYQKYELNTWYTISVTASGIVSRNEGKRIGLWGQDGYPFTGKIRSVKMTR